jgi:hypothetical protein
MKGLFTRTDEILPRRVVRHHATKEGINPNCVASCRATRHNKISVFRVNGALTLQFSANFRPKKETIFGLNS